VAQRNFVSSQVVGVAGVWCCVISRICGVAFKVVLSSVPPTSVPEQILWILHNFPPHFLLLSALPISFPPSSQDWSIDLLLISFYIIGR